MTDLSALQAFREDAPPREEPTIGPVVARRGRRVLAFDQSMANTGWALLTARGEVVKTGNLKTNEMGPAGHEDNLLRSQLQHEMMTDLLVTLRGNYDLVVHETPPRGGGKMARPESSLLAALALRIAFASVSMPFVPLEMVGAQTAKKRWVGNGNAKKREVAAALKQLDPTLTSMKPMNEAIYDAIAIGWVALEREP